MVDCASDCQPSCRPPLPIKPLQLATIPYSLHSLLRDTKWYHLTYLPASVQPSRSTAGTTIASRRLVVVMRTMSIGGGFGISEGIEHLNVIGIPKQSFPPAPATAQNTLHGRVQVQDAGLPSHKRHRKLPHLQLASLESPFLEGGEAAHPMFYTISANRTLLLATLHDLQPTRVFDKSPLQAERWFCN